MAGSSASGSVGTGYVHGLDEVVQLSTYLLRVAPERKGFRVLEVLWARDAKAPKVGTIVRPRDAGARNHRQISADGSVYGLKGPLLLTYESGLKESAVRKLKEALVCLFRAPEGLELSVNRAWLAPEKRAELLEAVKQAPEGRDHDVRRSKHSGP